MDVFEAINKRYSTRGFHSEPIPREIIEKLLEAARQAPSAGNLQPWFFYVVQDEIKREQLALAAGGQRFVAQAPLDIVVCAEPQVSAARYLERGASLYCLQDTAIAAQHIILAATAEGLGSCWVGAFDEDKVSEVLDIPSGRRPIAILAIGYPAAPPRGTSRKALDEITEWI